MDELVTIYGRDSCPHCVRAKELCIDKGFEFDYLIVGEDITRDELIAKVGQPVTKVPQIFIGDSYVGGFQDFYRKVMRSYTRVQ